MARLKEANSRLEEGVQTLQVEKLKALSFSGLYSFPFLPLSYSCGTFFG